jgi:hypothetical protein
MLGKYLRYSFAWKHRRVACKLHDIMYDMCGMLVRPTPMYNEFKASLDMF